MKLLRTILLAGPTAAGKSAVALNLAKRLGGEIISVDSMQVYRGLNLGTAKPTDAERAAVPHHLIDVADLTQAFDAAQFARLAKAAAEDILRRQRVPILSGGTGLYFKAFLEGLGEAPPSNSELRSELEKTALPELLGELKERDPVTFAEIDRQNPRRVVRALEVIRITGKPFHEQRADWKRLASNDRSIEKQKDAFFFGLERSREDLQRRIDERVTRMFESGLVAETERLLKLGLTSNRTAMQAIGYRQVVEHLQGVRSLAETMALVKQRTRQFAKRQMTWFRRQAEVEWIQVSPEETVEAVAERLIAKL
jgi:tRNA dimethylallyltransferase